MKLFEEAIQDYMNHIELKRSESTYKCYNYHLNVIRKELKNQNVIYLNDFSEEQINTMIRTFKKTCKNKTINQRLMLIKSIFKYAKTDNEYLFNLKRLRMTVEHYDPFREDELKKIMNYINSLDSSNPYELTKMIIVLLLLDTGVRQSELLNIEIRNIDLEARIIKLTHTKTKEQGFVFFTHLTAELLKEYIDFFPTRKYLLYNYKSYNRYTYIHLRNFMESMKKILKLKKCHAHMFRHTYATLLIENGCPLMSVKELMRHKDVSTTEIYVHMSVKKTKRDYNSYNVLDNL